MAVIVEDGTLIEDADSYIDEPDAYAYAVSMYGAADPFAALDAADQTTWLRRAAQSLDIMYNARWKGLRVNGAQALDWPRTDVEDEDGFDVASTSIPEPVRRAQVELARRILAGTDPLADITGGGDKKRVKVGPIDVEYVARAVSSKDIQILDRLLADYVTGDSNTVELARA